MGPLVPEVIGSEFNFVIALLVGIGFGFVLEQAGFSSSRKLAGVFYGYDFTVLRVFFTAGVTAMIGVILLNHLGLLDIDIIYVNPTFLYAALIGGAIMGFGFILGGFCPGTSVCAAAVGKIDAMAYLVGIFIGIFIFIEGFPIWENLFMAESMGTVRINEIFNMSQEMFAAIMTLVAVGSFFMVSKIEDRVNNRKPLHSRNKNYSRFATAMLPFFLLGIVAFTPNKKEKIVEGLNNLDSYNNKEIKADELASDLASNYYEINLIDVRSPEEYKKYHLPLAVNIPVDSLLNKDWQGYFKQNYKKNVFYADDYKDVKKACFIGDKLGESENIGMIESSNEFKQLYFNAKQPPQNATKTEMSIYNFRQKVAKDLINLDNALKKFSQPVKKKVKRVQGGCS